MELGTAHPQLVFLLFSVKTTTLVSRVAGYGYIGNKAELLPPPELNLAGLCKIELKFGFSGC